MINYVYAFICSIIFYAIIHYYVTNYCSDDKKELLNSTNNKIALFVCILLLFEGGLYLYTSNILKTFSTFTFNTSRISGGGGGNSFTNSASTMPSITSDKIAMEQFENTFISSITNQEVDVGVVPF